MRIDLHGLILFDAKEEVVNTIEICKSKGDHRLFIIHGYRNGQVLKNYFRSKKFLEEMKDLGHNLKIICDSDPGTTLFRIY